MNDTGKDKVTAPSMQEEEKDDDFKAQKKDGDDSFDDDFDQSEDMEHGEDEFDMEAYIKFRE